MMNEAACEFMCAMLRGRDKKDDREGAKLFQLFVDQSLRFTHSPRKSCGMASKNKIPFTYGGRDLDCKNKIPVMYGGQYLDYLQLTDVMSRARNGQQGSHDNMCKWKQVVQNLSAKQNVRFQAFFKVWKRQHTDMRNHNM